MLTETIDIFFIGLYTEKMKNIQIFLYPLVLCCFVMFFSTCSKAKTELDDIKETLERLAKNAEDKNVDVLLLYISEDYSDKKKRSKADIQALIERYTERFKGIVVNILEVRPVNPIDAGSDMAEVETDIAVSSGIARAIRKYTNIASRYYRFRIQLKKPGDNWEIIFAEWQHISKNQLSPESLSILEEILD